MNRSFIIKPGYDCRTECKHEIKGKHGACSDIWTYAVIDTDARAALELRIMTPFYPSTVDVSFLPDSLRTFMGTDICMHFGYPTSREQVRSGAKTQCKYIGVCYDAGSWSVMANELVTAHFDQEHGLKQGPIFAYQGLLQEQPALWAALEMRLAELVEKKQAARREDGDLRWRVCEHCKGQGVVSFDKPRVK